MAAKNNASHLPLLVTGATSSMNDGPMNVVWLVQHCKILTENNNEKQNRMNKPNPAKAASPQPIIILPITRE
jgi:hypothetical protein